MKPFYPITRPFPLMMIIFIIVMLAILLTSCSTQYETTYQQNCKEVTRTTKENRNIIGYENGLIFKNRVYYKVTDSEGKPAIRIYKHKDEPLRPIGSVLMLEDEYKLQN